MNAIRPCPCGGGRGRLKVILGVNDAPFVSAGSNRASRSAVFNATGTAAIDGGFARVTAGYDNERGFSNCISDTAAA